MSVEGGLVSECGVGSGSVTGWKAWIHGGIWTCVLMGGNDQLLSTPEPTMCQAVHWVSGDVESPCPSGALVTEKGM